MSTDRFQPAWTSTRRWRCALTRTRRARCAVHFHTHSHTHASLKLCLQGPHCRLLFAPLGRSNLFFFLGLIFALFSLFLAEQDAHAILILTEWDEFKELDYATIFEQLPTLFLLSPFAAILLTAFLALFPPIQDGEASVAV